MKPAIGLIVHFTSNRATASGSELVAWPAIITEVHEEDGTVSLQVFGETAVVPRVYVGFTDAPAGTEAAIGKWSWPVREG